jgi:hypothetical protein
MSKLTFNRKDSWFVAPDNKYGLSKYPAKDITEGNFSFLARVKVNWDKMNPDNSSREGGIIIKSGLHMGLAAVKASEDDLYIQSTIWTYSDEFKGEKTQSHVIFQKVENKNDYCNVCFTFDRYKNEHSLYFNGELVTEEFKGYLIDYTQSWLWVGVSNPLNTCPEEFRQFFNGEIYNVGIFSKCLNHQEIKKYFEDFNHFNPQSNAISLIDFKRQTTYKILDISGNGNNLVKNFDKLDVSWKSVI